MDKHEIKDLLHKIDDPTVEQLSRRYPGLTEADNERLFSRIEANLAKRSIPFPEAEEETFEVQEAPRFAWVRQLVPAAACIMAIVGTFAGLVMMSRNAPVPVRPESSASATSPGAYIAGERFAVPNLTSSGTLWMTLDSVEQEGGTYRVCITLHSQNAVSRTGTGEERYVFMADNFMAAARHRHEVWEAVAPVRIVSDALLEGSSSTFCIRPGETIRIELDYAMPEEPTEWRLVTSYSMDYPSVLIP